MIEIVLPISLLEVPSIRLEHGGVAAGARREGAHGRPELVRDAPQDRIQLRDRGHHDDGLLEEDLAAGRVRHHEGHWQDAI